MALFGHPVQQHFKSLVKVTPLTPEHIQSNIHLARILYYTGVDPDSALPVLRRAAAALHKQTLVPHVKSNTPWAVFIQCLGELPLFLQLHVCCIQTLSPALPLKQDF